MDNVLFESRITYTRDVVKQFVRMAYRAFFAVCFSMPVTIIILGVIMLVGGNEGMVLYIGVLLTIVLPITAILRSKRDMNIIYARTLEQNNGQEMTNVLQFNDENIQIVNDLTGNKTTYPYSCVKKVICRKDLMVLLTAAKVMIIADKTKFNVGNPEEFLSFIKTKL